MPEVPQDAARERELLNETSRHYREATVRLTQALIGAISASRQTAGLPTTGRPRHSWASVLFARLCGFGGSLMRLLPGSAASPTSSVWDFPSSAALTRCVFECYVVFHYLCVEKLDDDEWGLRMNVVNLHDCMERHRILGRFSEGDEELLARNVTDLRGRINSSKAFDGLSSMHKTRALSGRSHMYLTQDEIMERMSPPMDAQDTRGLYEFLSSATHTFPFGFYRTLEHEGRGTGRENRVEKGYMAWCADFAAQLLERAEADMQRVFDNVPKFERMRINWDTLECSSIGDHRAPMR